MFQSERMRNRSATRGLEASETTSPALDWGTYGSIFWTPGLMQPAATRLFATQGAPVESVYGWPVTGLLGLTRLIPRPVKSPLRSPDDGTRALMLWASR